jgi:hypothetical protein
VSELSNGAGQTSSPNPLSLRGEGELGRRDGDAQDPRLVDPNAAASDDATASDSAEADPYPGAVPPGYDWPTHGGYLGCLMGVVVGLLVGGFLGSMLIGLLSVSPLSAVVSVAAARLTLLALTFFATLILLGRVGYRLGRRYYREYPTPQRRRGEE